MQINRRWPIDWTERTTSLQPSALLVPEFPVPTGMRAELAALLPNSRYNENLFASLSARPSGTASAVIATVFAADPFLNVDAFVNVLQRSGIQQVANLPSIRQFGRQFCDDANNAGMGPTEELARLAQFEQAGIRVWVTVTAASQLIEMRGLEPAGLIATLAHGESPVAQDDQPDDSSQLARLCNEISSANSNQLPVLAMLGERKPGFRPAGLSGTIRYR